MINIDGMWNLIYLYSYTQVFKFHIPMHIKIVNISHIVLEIMILIRFRQGKP